MGTGGAGLLLVLGHLILPGFRLSALAVGALLAIYGLAAGVLFVVVRSWIRRLDDLYGAGTGLTTNVVVYGAGTSGMVVQRVIGEDRMGQYRIVAFLDDNPLIQGNRIRGIPVIDPAKLTRDFLEEFNVNRMIFTIRDISPSGKGEILRKAVKMGMEVLQVPPVSIWPGGNFQLNQLKKVELQDLLTFSPVKLNTRMITHGLRNRTILVTGAAGFTGAELIRQLCQYTVWRLILVDRDETALFDLEEELREEYPNAPVRSILSDVTDELMMNRIFEEIQPEIIFHTATSNHVPMMEENPHEAIRSNVGSAEVLTKLSMKHRVKKFVMVSSNQAVNPTNVMGASMRICEMLLQARSMTPGNRTQFVITRFGHLLESGGSVFHRFSGQIAAGGPVTVTHPEIRLCFMSTRESCQLMLEACFMGLGGEIFEFDLGEPFSVLEVARQMIRLDGKVPEKEIRIEFTGLRPGEILDEQLRTVKEKTLPTYNPKVKVAEVAWLDHRKVLSQIRSLLEQSPYVSKSKLIGMIEDFVTEYHSSLNKRGSATYRDSLELDPGYDLSPDQPVRKAQ